MNVGVRHSAAQADPRWQWGQDRRAEMLNVAARHASAPTNNIGADEQIAAILADAQAESRDLLLSSPLTLPLPSLPRAAGETAVFGQQIRAQIEEFRSRWPLFQSLLVPVTITFLVTPPAQGKDLDNIALTALPIAHEVLQPHIAPHLLAPRIPGRDSRPEHQLRLDRLRSVNARSVMVFQAIELPRTWRPKLG
jgi:hypothetical protein